MCLICLTRFEQSCYKPVLVPGLNRAGFKQVLRRRIVAHAHDVLVSTASSLLYAPACSVIHSGPGDYDGLAPKALHGSCGRGAQVAACLDGCQSAANLVDARLCLALLLVHIQQRVAAKRQRDMSVLISARGQSQI
mmetsp:Transcript_43672/g.79681  ORF Transcript_43672/g.79681 Transcript_43672/m.79681 type:complete len:136 (+) Transcript_43672:75-482(+)